MPNEPTVAMRQLVNQTENDIDLLMGALEAGAIDLDEWEDEYQQILTRNHLGAYMLGQASAVLAAAELLEVSNIIQEQLQFLHNFKIVIQSSEEFQEGWKARAQLYASATNRTWWTGKLKVWPLPAMPGQGTICHSNCRCEWVLANEDIEAGNVDAYWELDQFVEDHCQTCLQRNAEWYPVRVREGELQI